MLVVLLSLSCAAGHGVVTPAPTAREYLRSVHCGLNNPMCPIPGRARAQMLVQTRKVNTLRIECRKSIPGKVFQEKSIDTGSVQSALWPSPLGQGGWALYGNFVRDQHEKVLPLSAGKGDCQSEETTTVATRGPSQQSCDLAKASAAVIAHCQDYG
jgi:hypothetical protein